MNDSGLSVVHLNGSYERLHKDYKESEPNLKKSDQ